MIMTIGLEPDLKLVERLTFLQEDLGKILTHRGADSRWCRTRRPRIVMTLLVKNEEEMLAQQIEFHHALGVDHFIVTE